MPTRRRLTRWEIASVAAIGLIAVVLVTGYATSAFEARRRDEEAGRQLLRTSREFEARIGWSLATLAAESAEMLIRHGQADGITAREAFARELDAAAATDLRRRRSVRFSGSSDRFCIDGWLVRHHVRRDAPPTQSQWFLSLSRAPSEVPAALGQPSIALPCAVVISEKGDVALSADSSVLGSGETGIGREIIEFLETGTIHQLIEQDPRWTRGEER